VNLYFALEDNTTHEQALALLDDFELRLVRFIGSYIVIAQTENDDFELWTFLEETPFVKRVDKWNV